MNGQESSGALIAAILLGVAAIGIFFLEFLPAFRQRVSDNLF